MGGVIGAIVGELIDGGIELTRDAISGKLRNIADKIERGDIVPDAVLEKARNTAERLKNAKDRYTS
jgi:hypothetical protein